jgi:hypothetical protein
MKRVLALREAATKTQREIVEQQQQLKTITDDQVRLRANLKEMPATAAAYKRYLEKFDAQETQIEDYQAKIKELQAVEFKQKKELEDYLADFSAEGPDHGWQRSLYNNRPRNKILAATASKPATATACANLGRRQAVASVKARTIVAVRSDHRTIGWA